jgi:magnesium chelatase family protein
VLFLDELPEFSRACIEALREPLESGCIHLARVSEGAVFPAEFQLVCTMNPCPCGRPAVGDSPCRCTPAAMHLYRSKVSLPVLDRIDLWVPVLQETPGQHAEMTSESSATVRERVLKAWRRQLDRQGCVNARLRTGDAVAHARLARREQRTWHALAARHKLSARGAHRLLRVARTLADLQESERVLEADLLRAAVWRMTF